MRMILIYVFIFNHHTAVSTTANKYLVAHKNVPNFAMMLYCSIIKFKQKEITF